jgi:hypothetical protein
MAALFTPGCNDEGSSDYSSCARATQNNLPLPHKLTAWYGYYYRSESTQVIAFIL